MKGFTQTQKDNDNSQYNLRKNKNQKPHKTSFYVDALNSSLINQNQIKDNKVTNKPKRKKLNKADQLKAVELIENEINTEISTNVAANPINDINEAQHENND